MPRHNLARFSWHSSSAQTQVAWHSSMWRHTAAWQPAAIKYASAQSSKLRSALSAASWLLWLHPLCCSHRSNLQSLIYLPHPKCLLIAPSLALSSRLLPPSHFLSRLLVCLRIHWGFTTIELQTGLSNTMSDGGGVVGRNQWADVIS